MNMRRVNRIDELAQDVPPARDLWPAIAQAIEAEKAASAHGQTGPGAGLVARARRCRAAWPRWWRWRPDRRHMRQNFVTRRQRRTCRRTPASGDARGVSAGCRIPQAARALLVDVQKRLETMPAAERAKVAASLATLRRSIGEIEAALGRDPANALLQELLVNSCQEEMRALTAVRDSGSQEI